jgi:aerobic-type carbon monoxide dehydrogenase small subunit (CoxS/CutS family)
MSDSVLMTINGLPVEVAPGTTVAVAVMSAGWVCRRSVSGTPRGPLCGMGICYECRLTINGQPHCRSCQVLCEAGMDVRTNE